MDKSLTVKQVSDEELALEAQAGSRRSFERLVYRYSHRLFHYLRAKIPTDQDTEDLVQETFLKAYQNIHRYNPEYKFSTWIYTVANRLAISHYRRKRLTESTYISASSAADPQERMIRQEDSWNLWHIASTLEQNQYQALWLRYMEEMSLKEIARVMKMTQIYVRVLLHRARANLIKRLNPCVSPGETNESAPVERELSFKIGR